MRIPIPIFAVMLATMAPVGANAAGLPPWQFGMTKEQVKSFRQFGPYKTFSNGDLETFNGVFHGRKENIQFFFENNRLVSIGVYLWEGKHAKEGIPVWRRAYELLQKQYGKVAMPEIHVAAKSDPVTPEVLAIAAAGHTYATGNTRLEPVKQPRGIRVRARFMGMTVKKNSFVMGTTPMGNMFAIAIFFDPR